MRPAVLVALAVVLAGCLGAVSPPDASTAPIDATQLLTSRLSPTDADAMEVDVAVDPARDRVLAASNLRSETHDGFGIYTSGDGGRSWSFAAFEPGEVARLADRPRFRALSDPVVQFGPDGTAYLAGLAYLPTSAIFVAESPDGGATWTDVHLVDESDPATEFNDKEWFDVDPATGAIVVAWQKEPLIDSLRQVEYATGLDVDVGDVVFSRSTDDGATWSEPVQVDRGMHNNGTQVVFDDDGTGQMIWVNYKARTLDHVRSDDGGATWTDPTPIADVRVVPPYDDYQRMHTLPALASGPDGTLVAVWHDARDGDADVYAVASADGGRSWGPATAVVEDDDRVQLYPWVAVDPDGRIHVTFYDGTTGDGFELRYVHATADGVGPEGTLAFGTPEPVSEPFDVAGRNGLLGDYTAVEATDAATFLSWADGRDDRPQVFAARVGR